MPPTLRNSQDYGDNVNRTVYTFSYNNDGSFLAVGITSDGRPVAGVTYAGDALTKAVGRILQDGQAEIWYRNKPAKGVNNLVITHTGGANHCMALCSSWTGVDGSQGTRDTAETSGWNQSTVLVTLSPTLPDDLCLYHGGVNRDVAIASSGCTQIQERISGESDECVLGYEIATGASEIGGAWWNSGSNAYAVVGAAFYPAVPGGNQVIWIMSKMRDFFKDLRLGLIHPEELHRRYRGLKEQGLLTI